ncbi:lysine-2,3-aminomutase-like protein [Methylocapsa acidiphila]|uniref:lysine-2,3-aminomutase-like protein n=1 Tax=Methylocapsa acidiphila TaxID=133552 RepID=UPI000416F73B|nr:lysine-2,3-aminomutase-like protein [Methylocapsa acidiphila]
MKNHGPALRGAGDLVAAGLAAESERDALERVSRSYAIGLTETVAGLIDRADPHDPIARQFLPDLAELKVSPHERVDPVGDDAFSPVDGIVHRYPDRVLLKFLHHCPVYCRFCFRRETVGPGAPAFLSPAALDAAFAYVADHPEIWEAILTGGDPLMLSPRRLDDIMMRLSTIDHVKIVRLHTRVPAVDPDAVTDQLAASLRASGKTVYLALHANHPRELSPRARAACARLIDAGIPMLSQTVLLAGVNDDAETLAALMRGFVEARIKPYYLHQLDLAPGTAHFRVPIARGQELIRQLRGRLSGLCQPTYMLDLPGGLGKTPIGPNYLTESAREGFFRIEDYRGATHLYPPQDPAPDLRADARIASQRRKS